MNHDIYIAMGKGYIALWGFQGRPHICHGYHGLYFWRKFCHVKKFQIFVKNLNNLWRFIEVYAVFVLNLCGEKKWQIWGLGQKCNKSENTIARSVSARKWKMRSAQIWFDGVAPASTRLNGSQKKKNIKIETELQPPLFGKCQRSNDTFWPVLIW